MTLDFMSPPRPKRLRAAYVSGTVVAGLIWLRWCLEWFQLNRCNGYCAAIGLLCLASLALTPWTRGWWRLAGAVINLVAALLVLGPSLIAILALGGFHNPHGTPALWWQRETWWGSLALLTIVLLIENSVRLYRLSPHRFTRLRDIFPSPDE